MNYSHAYSPVKVEKISHATSKRFFASHSSYSLSVMKLNFSTRANQRRAADDISQYCHKIEPSIKVTMGSNNAEINILMPCPSLQVQVRFESGPNSFELDQFIHFSLMNFAFFYPFPEQFGPGNKFEFAQNNLLKIICSCTLNFCQIYQHSREFYFWNQDS